MNKLEIFWRNLQKQKAVSILSVGSLSIAIAVATLIGLWARNEFSYDNFHRDGRKIYRMVGQVIMNGNLVKTGSTWKEAGDDAIQTFPEVEEMCRIVSQSGGDIKANETLYPKEQVFIADSSFFTFFSFALKTGNPHTCLSSPDGAVIDEYTANRYFPGENPIGKNIRYGEYNFNVTGVMENMPSNSHLKAHIIFPFFGYWAQNQAYGDSDVFMTYLKIADARQVQKIEQGMTGIIQKVHPMFQQLAFEFRLEPLRKIYFNNTYKFDGGIAHGNKMLAMVFMLTACVILLIACINFINLFISTSFLRAKAIGIKKTYGADKRALVGEFYGETFYYVLLATAIGAILAEWLLPLFNRLADSQLAIDFKNPATYLFLGAVVLAVVLAAGTIPAFYMTKFNTIETVKGQFKGKNLSFLQKGLIITQFTAAITILISVFFIEKQVSHMVHKDLGFDKENIFYVVDGGGFQKNYDAFAQEMLTHPAIAGVTMKDINPLGWCRGSDIQKPGDEQKHLVEYCAIKPDYFRVMGMEMKAGKEFAEKAGDSLLHCIINETAARMLGFADPVGEKVVVNQNQHRTIIGVVKDAHTKSLHQPIDPQVYLPYDQNTYTPTILFRAQGNPQEAIRLVQAKWNELNPGRSFEYHFLDSKYAQLYHAETNAENILGAALAITFVISVAGLFAMAYYASQRRLKEIGVRKVNGATLRELLLILNRDFFMWVGISYLLACPIAYFFVNNWLQGFVERTPMSWWIFALAGAVAFFVTLLTVSWQTWQAATVNPVKCLKSE